MISLFRAAREIGSAASALPGIVPRPRRWTGLEWRRVAGNRDRRRQRRGDRGADRARCRSAIAIPASDGELVFGFLIDGEARLEFEGSHQLAAGDAFVIPPDASWALTGDSYRLLHVATRRADRV